MVYFPVVYIIGSFALLIHSCWPNSCWLNINNINYTTKSTVKTQSSIFIVLFHGQKPYKISSLQSFIVFCSSVSVSYTNFKICANAKRKRGFAAIDLTSFIYLYVTNASFCSARHN